VRLRREPDGPAEESIPAEALMPTHQCRSCGEWIGAELEFCPDCRTPLHPAQTHGFHPLQVMTYAAALAAVVFAVLLLVQYLVAHGLF
jgi:hypothetical protein